MTIEKIRFQHQALQNFRRRIERIELSPKDVIDAAMAVTQLERRIQAQWGVLFGAFLRQVNG